MHGHHAESISDLQYCKYLIAVGRTVGPNVGTTHGTLRLVDAIERGLKLVVVDPRFSRSVGAYRWIPIRPGTELAFVLALIHCVFFEIGKFDEWFVKNRTNGPYLIGADGFYLRDDSTNKPLIWDSADGRAKVFDDASIKDYALFGEYRIGNTSAHPSLHLIKERMKEYTPEWAEQMSTIPASTIREVAREFVEHASIGSTMTIEGEEFPFRPAQFAGSGRGAVSQRNGTLFDLAGKILNLLIGAVEVPGGITGNRNPGPGPFVLEPDPGRHRKALHGGGRSDYLSAGQDIVERVLSSCPCHALYHGACRLDPQKYNVPYHSRRCSIAVPTPYEAAVTGRFLSRHSRRCPSL